ncbi:hypothetical protein AB0O28_31215 [Microbispora sp. NPDC088329]|uniref:hypothetical protein n=1 Tax=Microbispora sp. NPDC088329 TaxID=3154869 RepID=UPI0034139B68
MEVLTLLIQKTSARSVVAGTVGAGLLKRWIALAEWQRVPRIRGYYEYPDGLTPGLSKDGGIHQNLYDDQGRLTDHGTFFPDDENRGDPPPVFVNVTNEYTSDSQATDPLEVEALLGALVLLGAIVALKKAEPYVKRWWNDQALPTLKSTWNRLARTRMADSRATTAELSTLAGPAPADSSREVLGELEECRASMSSAEARERFVAALTARLFSEEQIKMLCNARIGDDDGSSELNSTMGMLTPKQIGDGIALMLEANPSLLDEATLTELGRILGRSRDGGYVPLGNEKIKEALRLVDGPPALPRFISKHSR